MATKKRKKKSVAKIKRINWCTYVDAEQNEILERGLASLVDRPTAANWMRRVMLREAQRAIKGLAS